MTWFGLRLSTIALATLFGFMLTGLYVADRTLGESDDNHAAAEATQSAALVESFLAVHAEALTAFRGLYTRPGERITRDAFLAVVTALGEHASGFQRLFLTDSNGVVQHEALVGGDGTPLPSPLDIDTLTRLGMSATAARARATRRTQVSVAGTLFVGERGVVLLEPVVVDGRLTAFAGGIVTSDALLSNLRPQHSGDRLRLVLRSGADTVASFATTTHLTAPRHAVALARLPGGGAWEIVVARAPGSAAGRLTLWVIGLGILGTLTLGLVHERRQARRIADRSAELERLSSELLRANRAKSEFLANVSHELRTPLNAIVGFVELLRDGVYGDLGPRQVSPVQRIEASANHLRHLVDQILDLAKMAAGRLEVHKEILDLRPFVFDVASEVESLIQERGLNFSLAVPASLPRVRTDPTHLRQILVNLLGNAVKYTMNGGIAVRARLAGATGEVVRHWHPPSDESQLITQAPRPDTLWIALQVADSGIGIAEADRERIFDEFEQVNAGPRGDSAQRGTGLGLPISRRLARLIGGDITLESELGKGSTFTLWLQVDPADLRA